MNPISEIKSNISVTKIVGFVVIAVVVFGILDALGATSWILAPYSTFKAKFMKQSA